ncbi:MAG: binding sensor regulator [Acidimicrobiales bacterium]|nr:binding sensor regulator [Acidimicrobiales bacterium]
MPKVPAVEDLKGHESSRDAARRRPSPDRFHEFSVEIGFDAGQAVVGVGGDIDAATAPLLGALLDVLVEHGHTDIVLDLATLAFMDAAGLSAFATVAERLKRSDGVLTIRSAPARTLLILDLTGVSKVVRVEAPDRSTWAVTRAPDLPSDLARLASLPARNEVVDAALRLVAVLTSETLEGADGVSVSLERRGRMTTVASSNDTVLRMDAHQYGTGQGPCLAAAAEGREFHIDSLADESRWPDFVPRAMEEGIASILSTPLMSGGRPVGALNVYSSTAGVFKTPQQDLAVRFATQASGILTDAEAVTDDQLVSRILDELSAREIAAQARGVLMARHGVSPDEAAVTLLRSARAANLTVLQQATAVLASTRADVDSGDPSDD